MSTALAEGGSSLQSLEGRGVTGGFSLLELLVSLGILSISFMAIIPLLTNTMGLNKSTDMAAVAQTLASQKIEELMATPHSVTAALLGTAQNFQAPPEYITATGAITTNPSEATFKRIWRIDPLRVRDSSVAPVPLALTAMVKYSYKGVEKTRSFTTVWSY